MQKKKKERGKDFHNLEEEQTRGGETLLSSSGAAQLNLKQDAHTHVRSCD